MQARRLTIGGQQGVGGILLWQPLDLVDFLLYLQALEIVELWLMALESAVDVILALAVRCIFTLQGNPDRALSSRTAGWVGAGTKPGQGALTRGGPDSHGDQVSSSARDPTKRHRKLCF